MIHEMTYDPSSAALPNHLCCRILVAEHDASHVDGHDAVPLLRRRCCVSIQVTLMDHGRTIDSLSRKGLTNATPAFAII